MGKRQNDDRDETETRKTEARIVSQAIKGRLTEIEEHRTKLYEGRDKLVFLVTSGALLLSVTDIDKMGLPQTVPMLVLLLFAWGSLVLGLMANLFSYSSAIKDGNNRLHYYDDGLKDPKTFNIETLKTEGSLRYRISEPRKWEHITDKCNNAAMILMLFGITLLAVYAGKAQFDRLNSLSLAIETESA